MTRGRRFPASALADDYVEDATRIGLAGSGRPAGLGRRFRRLPPRRQRPEARFTGWLWSAGQHQGGGCGPLGARGAERRRRTNKRHMDCISPGHGCGGARSAFHVPPSATWNHLTSGIAACCESSGNPAAPIRSGRCARTHRELANVTGIGLRRRGVSMHAPRALATCDRKSFAD